MLDRALGQIEIAGKSLTIDGGTLGITINGNDPSATVGNGIRIFNITDPTSGTNPPLVTTKGLTLTGGDPSSVGPTLEGGAIRSEARLVLENMTIENNAAYSGGGVYVAVAAGGSGNRDVLTIEDSTIEGNSATAFGGGVFVQLTATTGDHQTARIINSDFQENNSADSGGAVYITGTSTDEDDRNAVFITSSEFELNEAGFGGAIFHTGTRVDVSIEGTDISDNEAITFRGGGIHANLFDSRLQIQDSVISGNRADQGFLNGSGGGVSAVLDESSSLAITDSQITGNYAGKDGGGVFALADWNLSNPFPDTRAITITRCLISENRAEDRGGGLYTYTEEGTETLVEDSRITGNKVLNNPNGGYRNGGGIYAYLHGFDYENIRPRFIITGSTVDNNEADNFGGGIFVCSKKFGHFIATNSTISSNETLNTTDGRGGGIVFARVVEGTTDVDLRNVTITQNESADGGGVWIKNLAGIYVRIANSIISQNRDHGDDPNNLVGPVVVEDFLHNLIGNGSAILDHTTGEAPEDPLDSSNKLNNDTPGLSALAYLGGHAQAYVHALMVGSAAIDNGSNDLASDPLTPFADFEFDQRGTGFQRIFDVPFVNNNNNLFTVDIGAYEMSLSFLPGDYDRDGEVDCHDYLLWRSTFGNTVAPMSGADGNGDGTINAADYSVWFDNFEENAGKPIGDFNDDGITDKKDYDVWYSTFGSTSDLRADANCDGVVNAVDFTIWRDTVGSTINNPRFGLFVSAFDTDAPAAVVGVGVDSAAGGHFGFGLVVGSGEQLRSVPLASPNSYSITFTQDVTVSQNDLVIENLDGTSPTVTSFAYVAQSHTATWTFTSSLADGRYLVRLSDAIENAENEALDGEFDNPWFLTETGTSELASGDGEEGNEFRFRFTVLAGDSDHNNIHGATNYVNWKSYEPGMIYASRITDEYDADLSFGDVSLREAANHANTAGVPTAIDLKSGTYSLTISGAGAISQGDLDITGNVTILGNGPGISIIDAAGMSNEARHFDVASSGVLNVWRATLKLGEVQPTTGPRDGGAVRVQDGGQLHVDYSAIVGNFAGKQGDGGAIYFAATGSGSIRNSVITVNETEDLTGGVHLAPASPGTGGAVIVGNSIVAKNTGGGSTDVYAGTNRTFTSEGNNRLGNVTTGFTNGVNGDYVGTPHYIVTTVADVYDGSSDPYDMTVRDAIHRANITAGAQEIWLPAWDFMLDRDRATYGSGATDVDIAFGDLDIKGPLTIRGIADATSIEWKPDVVDRVMELLGDYNGDGTVNAADQTVGNDTEGATPDPGAITADGDDDGDIDEDDEDIWAAYFGYTFGLFNVSLPG